MREPIAALSYAEFLKLEAQGDQRHEYLDGQLFAMAGGTPEHAALAAAIVIQLGNALRGKPCRVYSSDLRVRVSETGLSTYPDVSVVRGQFQSDPIDSDAIVNPVLLVEVLSDTTEGYDRGAKAAHYRRIATLREYVLVSQREPLIEVYRRNEQGRFELFEFRSGEQVEFASVGAVFALDAVYENPLSA
ncbi:MAG: Uma2 family endonuclease [Polyangiaceae bacterium]